MTDHDVIHGTERNAAGPQPPAQAASEARSSASRRVLRLIGQHKLGSALAALFVVAAIVGVATGSLNGPSNGSTGSTSRQDNAITYSHPAAAPAFSLPALSGTGSAGQDVSLSQYQGKPLVVNFFASWCGPCQQETPLLASFYKASHGSVTLVGVDGNDPTASAVSFARAKGVTYPVGVDPHLIVASAYNVGGFPQTFFLNSRHQVVYRVLGALTQSDLTHGVSLIGR